MSESKFNFPAVQYCSIGNGGDLDGASDYVLTYFSEQEAIENSERPFEDGSAMVAEYRLVRVRRLKLQKTTKIKEVK